MTAIVVLRGKERAEFIRLSKACSNLDQVKRITARLLLTRFIRKHGEAVCRSTFEDIMKKAQAR
jgi:hypothetical protein